MNLVDVGRFGLLPLVLGALACSDMDPGSDTFRTVYPNLAQGGGGNGPAGTAGSSGSAGADGEPELDQATWGCLSDGITMPQMPRARITYQVGIVDFDSQTLNPRQVPGLVVEVCQTTTCDLLLPPCDPTMGEPTPTQQCATVTQGPVPVLWIVNLPYGLENAGLKLTAPNYVQMNYLFGGPMIGTPEGSQTVVGLTIPLLTEDTRRRVYQQVQVGEVDLANGTLAVRTLSCARQPNPLPAMPPPPQGQRARQIQIETEREVPAPAVHWILSPGNQFDDDSQVTDGRGVAGILNVTPQSIRVKGLLPNGEEYSPTVLPVLANTITLAELRPGLELWGQ